MIDFQSIRYTTAGLECYYLGQRRSVDGNVHRFAVVNPAGEKFAYYNDQGQRIEFDDRTGKWVVTPKGHQIIAPPKIVEVTRWITYHRNDNGEIGCKYHSCDPENKHLDGLIGVEKVTKRFEVPND